MKEISNTVTRKKFGKAIKYKVGNYRFEKYKANKFSTTGAVELGFYASNNTDVSVGSFCRNLHKVSIKQKRFLERFGCEKIIFVESISDTLGDDSRFPHAYTHLTLQFTVEDLGVKLVDNIFNVVEECLIEIVEDSLLTVVDK